MCDMYGHGYYEPKHQTVRCDYMKWNSHSEIGPEELAYPIYPKMRVEHISPSHNSSAKVSYTGVAFETETLRSILRSIPYGVDPIDGSVIFHRGGRSEKDNDPRPLDKLLIRATWDKQIPTISRMCDWIEAHFGKRGDEADWARRGPRLVNIMGRDRFDQQELDVTCAGDEKPRIFRSPIATTPSQLMDAFCQFPNEFWQRSYNDKRYDKACYVLEAAGMN